MIEGQENSEYEGSYLSRVKSSIKSWHILLLLMAVAAAIRILAALTRPIIQFDETAYVTMAESLTLGLGPEDLTREVSTYFSPLLPLFITSFAFILRNHVLSGYVVNIVIGSLTLFPIYLLGKEFAGRRVGLMAAALLAVWPLFVDYSTRIYSETLFVFFLLLAVVFGRHMLQGCRVPCSILTGMTLGLAYLANPAAIYYLFVFIVLHLIMAARKGVWLHAAKAAAIFLLLFLVFAGPYWIFLHSQLGKWTYTGKDIDVNAYTASAGLNYQTSEWDEDVLQLVDDGTEVKLNRLPDKGDPLTVFISEPVNSAKIFIRQSYDFYSRVLPEVIPLWLLPLAGLGLFSLGWNRNRALWLGYMLLMMVPALLVLTVYVHERFFMAYVPFVIIWIAFGWERLENWGRETVDYCFQPARAQRLQRWVPWVLGFLVIMPILIFTTADIARQEYAVEYREAGEWIKESAGGGQLIMNRESMSAYYSDGTPVDLPYADYQATTDYARHKDVDYLVISASDIENYRPQLSMLLDDNFKHPEWKTVHTIRPGTSRETLILQLVK